MNNIVVTYQNVFIDEQHIRIKKACVYSTQVVWNTMYSVTDTSKEQSFLLQTPWMVIPYPVIFKDESKTFQFTCCHDEFCNKLLEIETHILKRVRSAHVDLHNKKMLNCVRTLPVTHDKILKLTGNTFDTSFFDQNGNRLHDAQCLSQHKRICMILFIKSSWCSSMYYGLDVVPLQIKVEVLPKLNELSFIPESGDVDEKYHRMIRMRIPTDAVRNRMKLDGFDDATINEFISTVGCSSNGAPKDKLPPTLPATMPPSPPKDNIATPMLGFLSQIKTRDFKLKRITDDDIGNLEKKVEMDRKISKIVVDKSRHIVPSLDDILHAKEKLRGFKKK
jgi:hypothetical protein